MSAHEDFRRRDVIIHMLSDVLPDACVALLLTLLPSGPHRAPWGRRKVRRAREC
jgi:hypothetical protein